MHVVIEFWRGFAALADYESEEFPQWERSQTPSMQNSFNLPASPTTAFSVRMSDNLKLDGAC